MRANIMVLDTLRKIGLSEGEIKVYSVLLDLGSSPLNKIHESVGIERRNIYDILNKLIERGLVAYIAENKKRYFHVTPPKRILGYLEERQEEIEQIKKRIEPELQKLTQKFEAKKTAIHAEVYRGSEGVKTVWEDMLDQKAIYWIGSGRYVPKSFPHFFSRWNARRIEKKITMYNLIRSELRPEITTPFKYEKIHYLPREFSGNPTVICVWGNKVGNFLFGKELFVFVIESKELAENCRAYHKYLWENVAKP